MNLGITSRSSKIPCRLVDTYYLVEAFIDENSGSLYEQSLQTTKLS